MRKDSGSATALAAADSPAHGKVEVRSLDVQGCWTSRLHKCPTQESRQGMVLQIPWGK